MRHWTSAERERQGQLIQSWRPWAKSTGPRTNDGKDRSSRNAFKHGMRSAAHMGERRKFNALLKECRDLARHCLTADG
jgi:hypothetical protein